MFMQSTLGVRGALFLYLLRWLTSKLMAMVVLLPPTASLKQTFYALLIYVKLLPA